MSKKIWLLKYFFSLLACGSLQVLGTTESEHRTMKPGFQNMEPRGEQHIVVKVILLNYI